MDSSYTNPYGSQPSIPNGGQMQPADFPSQGDIILSPDQSSKKLDLKRILILAGAALAVVALVAIVVAIISGNNRAASEASKKRQDTLEAITKLGEDYDKLISNYQIVGYEPSSAMSHLFDDDSRFFLLRQADLTDISLAILDVEKDISNIEALDFDVLAVDIKGDMETVLTEIKSAVNTIKTNNTTLKVFYNTFVTAVEKLNSSNAVDFCDFSVADISGLTVSGQEIDDAIRAHELAFCSINDEIYYDVFDGRFSTVAVRDAKEALAKTLLNLNNQQLVIAEYDNILTKVGIKQNGADDE